MTSKEPLWKGPYEDGLTQSLISRFLVCPHRFWLYAVCGASDKQTLNVPIAYGDAFHQALERYALGKTSPAVAGEAIKDSFHRLSKQFPFQTHEATRWSRICYDQFLAYCKVWKDDDKGLSSFMEEQSFKVPYTLPSGRVIIMRGKWDGGVLSKSNDGETRYLFEHKIKGEIDVKNLEATLAQNFQVMYYLPPLYAHMDSLGLPRPQGVIYNVIQRPLAGGKHSIQQKKGRKVKVKGTNMIEIKGAETSDQFLGRLASLYTQHPEDFFFRWRVSISEEEVERFKVESLNPILEQVCDWWDSIKDDPFDPWTTPTVVAEKGFEPFSQTETYPTYLVPGKKVNKNHYRRPFGLFDKMAKGLVGDFQPYLTTGDKSSLQKVTSVFPELD